MLNLHPPASEWIVAHEQIGSWNDGVDTPVTLRMRCVMIGAQPAVQLVETANGDYECHAYHHIREFSPSDFGMIVRLASHPSTSDEWFSGSQSFLADGLSPVAMLRLIANRPAG